MSPGGTVLLPAVLITLLSLLSEASMDGGAEQSPGWQRTAEWQAYKQLHAAARSPKSLTEMEAVEHRIRRGYSSLRRIFPGNEQLVTDLAAFLFDAAHMRRLELQRSPGRPARPDVNGELSDLLERLEQRFAVLRGLRAVGGTDPWIATEVEALVIHSVRAADATLGQVDRSQPDATALIQRTRDMLRTVRAWLRTSGVVDGGE